MRPDASQRIMGLQGEVSLEQFERDAGAVTRTLLVIHEISSHPWRCIGAVKFSVFSALYRKE